jgi:hypothetical protein
VLGWPIGKADRAPTLTDYHETTQHTIVEHENEKRRQDYNDV